MSDRLLIDKQIWEINGFPIHVELYDSKINIKDENGNSMRISKKNHISVILNLNGSFKSD